MNSIAPDPTDKNSLVTVIDGEAVTTTFAIAEGTRVQHKNVLELVRNNVADFEEFGRVAFKTEPFVTAGGAQERTVAILNEQHATLLLTFMRNSPVVKEFKKRLVRAFFEMKKSTHAPELSGPELMARALIEADSTIKAKEARIAELEAPAKSWNTMASAGGDYSVAEAAKSLSRDPQITIGRDQLFAFLNERGWIFRTRGHRAHWEANQQKAMNTGRLAHKLSRPFLNESTGEWEQGKPTVRVTPKGLHELHLLLGGSGQLELVAVS